MQGPNARPPLAALQDQSNLSTVPSSSPPLPACNPLRSIQSLAIAAPPLCPTCFLPWFSPAASVGQSPGPLVVLPTQPVQGKENTHPPGTLACHWSTRPTLGGALPPTHPPLLPPYRGICQEHNEHTGMAALPFQDSPQPDPDNPKQQLQDLAQPGTSHAMQQWGEGPQVVTAREEPQERAVLQPAHTDTHVWQQQVLSAKEPAPAPGQQHQRSAETSSLLDELLADAEVQEKAQPFLNGDLQAEEPPGTPEELLSGEEFQALLDMLQCSPGPPI